MNIATFQSNLDFIKSLYLLKEWKDEDCKKEILEAIKECNQKIEKAFGQSMHKLDKHRPSNDAVEKVVQKFPSTLSYEDEGDGDGATTDVDATRRAFHTAPRPRVQHFLPRLHAGPI